MKVKGSYNKSLGVFELVSLGVGGTIGSGIFVVPGIAAGMAGPSSLIAWLIAVFQLLASCCLLHGLPPNIPLQGLFTRYYQRYSEKKHP